MVLKTLILGLGEDCLGVDNASLRQDFGVRGVALARSTIYCGRADDNDRANTCQAVGASNGALIGRVEVRLAAPRIAESPPGRAVDEDKIWAEVSWREVADCISLSREHAKAN